MCVYHSPFSLSFKHDGHIFEPELFDIYLSYCQKSTSIVKTQSKYIPGSSSFGDSEYYSILAPSESLLSGLNPLPPDWAHIDPTSSTIVAASASAAQDSSTLQVRVADIIISYVHMFGCEFFLWVNLCSFIFITWLATLKKIYILHVQKYFTGLIFKMIDELRFYVEITLTTKCGTVTMLWIQKITTITLGTMHIH